MDFMFVFTCPTAYIEIHNSLISNFLSSLITKHIEILLEKHFFFFFAFLSTSLKPLSYLNGKSGAGNRQMFKAHSLTRVCVGSHAFLLLSSQIKMSKISCFLRML